MTRYRYVAVLWTLLILLGCWLPPSILARSGHAETGGPIMGFIPRDKFVHTVMFAGFGALWMAALPPRRRVLKVVAAGLLLAAATELGQELPLVNRDANLPDAIADGVGVLIGVACSWPLLGRLPGTIGRMRVRAPEPGAAAVESAR